MKYRAEIDGLRALAVIHVILFHAGFELFGGGFVGVDVFFVISGYLITTIIINEMDEGKFSLVNFYERRARRILPALFFVMLVCLPFAWYWLLPSDLKDFSQSVVAVSIFSSNILFWRESGYFDTAAELKPLLHTWSLAVEEQYYLLFPLFLLLTWRLGKKWILVLLGIAFPISLGLAHWAGYNNPSADFYLLPPRGWELLLGVFAGFYLQRNEYLKSNTLNQIGSLIGVSLILYSIFAFDSQTPFPSLYTLAPTVGAALLIFTAVKGTWIGRALCFGPIVGIGLISYSAYLWQQPLISFTRYRFIDLSDSILVLLCCASIVLAYFSWKYVEGPFRNRTKLSQKTIFATSIVLASSFLLLGSWGSQNGFLKRYNPAEQTVFESYIDPAVYVTSGWNNFVLKEFDSNDETKNVMLIGDSFAYDVFNASHETNLHKSISFSTFFISKYCKYLVDPSLLKPYQMFPECERYENNHLRELMKQSDEIWIASAWSDQSFKEYPPWNMEFMKDSINNIQSLNNKAKIIVFGRKSFGDRNQRLYMRERTLEELFKEKPLPDEHVRVAQTMAKEMPLITNYIDTSKLLCGSYKVCTNRTIDGNVISYDGFHLTKYGAKYFGKHLEEYFEKHS